MRSVITFNILVLLNFHFLGGGVKGVCSCVSVCVGVDACYSSSGHIFLCLHVFKFP